jgi:hypothetical protein
MPWHDKAVEIRICWSVLSHLITSPEARRGIALWAWLNRFKSYEVKEIIWRKAEFTNSQMIRENEFLGHTGSHLLLLNILCFAYALFQNGSCRLEIITPLLEEAWRYCPCLFTCRHDAKKSRFIKNTRSPILSRIYLYFWSRRIIRPSNRPVLRGHN